MSELQLWSILVMFVTLGLVIASGVVLYKGFKG